MAISTFLKKFSIATAGAAILTLGATGLAPAQAIVLSSTNEDSIADSGFDLSGQGTHFHDGDFGTPPDLTEVGNFFDEEVRGVAEFNLSSLFSLSALNSATLKFDVFDTDGLFDQGSGAFDINVLAFIGNGQENLSDFQISTVSLVSTFSTAAQSVGDTISFDITSIIDTFKANGEQFLGFRLQASSLPEGKAIAFDNFRIDAKEDSQSVPEPSSALGLMILGAFSGVSQLKRKQQRKVTVKF